MRYRMKRLLAELLSAVMLLSLLPAMAWAAGDFPDSLNGEGEASDPYQIESAEQLAQLSEYVNGGHNCQDTYFELTADIDLGGDEGNQWTPIGNVDHKFQGSFDGGSHTISGLYIDSFDYNLGLFGYIDGGTVKNLGVSGYIKVHGSNYAGGIAGTNYGTITGCHSACTIESGDWAGGIVGYNTGPVSDCYNIGSISGAERAGGIVGHNSGDISDCYNAGAVSGKTYAGGIVGDDTGHTFKNCYNVGEVTGTGSRGGIAGAGSSGHSTYENCYFLADTAEKGVGNDTGNTTGVEQKSEDEFKSLATELGEGWTNDPFLGRPALKANREPWPISGSGTEDAPFKIPDKETLEAFRNYVNAGNNCANMYFKLTNNINLDGGPGNEWTPIGNSGNTFQGTFDGGGVTVSGLSINSRDSSDYVGLFGYIGDGGSVKNLTVAGEVSGRYAGGIVGQNYGTIENCYNTAEVTGTTGDTGGIVGYNSRGTIKNCHNAAKVTGGTRGYTGGIVGNNSGGTIENCDNRAEVTGTNGHIGGIVGNDGGGTIENCYNAAEVTGIDGNIGGIVGDSNSGTIENCDNAAEVTGTTGGIVGGIAGMSRHAAIHGCCNRGTVSGYFVGGIVGNNGTESEVKDCYNNGKVNGDGPAAGGIAGSSYATIENCYNSGMVSGSTCGGIIGQNTGTATNCYYLDTALSGFGYGGGDATPKTEAEFASGEVAWLLQGGQEPQVWGQALKGGSDAYPVLTGAPEKRVYKVTFCTEKQPEPGGYAVKYANSGGVKELPDAPTLEGMAFDHWSTEKSTSSGTKFDEETQVTGDITVYAVGRPTFAGESDTITLTTTYGNGKTEDLSQYVAYALQTSTAGVFNYEITEGNDNLNAKINGDILEIPENADASEYTLTIEAKEKEPGYSLMSMGPYGTDPVTLTVEVIIQKANSEVQTQPTAKTLTYTGAERALVTDGVAAGGTMQYALGENGDTAPGENEFKADIPMATEARTYYVWYYAKGDTNHTDSTKRCVPVTIGKAAPTVTIQTVGGTYGDEITLTAKVVVSGVDTSLIDGDVTFKAGTEVLNTVYAENSTATLTIKADNRDLQHKLFGTDGKNIIVTAEYEGNSNIEHNSGTETVTIMPKTLTFNFTAQDKTYDGNSTIEGTFDALTNQLVSGDNVEVDEYTATADNADAGENKAVTVTVSTLKGTDAGYYTPGTAASNEVEIRKAEIDDITAPTANNRIYDGTEENLVSSGSSTKGTMVYALGDATEADGNYSETIPQKKDAGTYYVWYYVQGDGNHEDSVKDKVAVTIEQKPVTLTWFGHTGLVYTGTAKNVTATIPVDGIVDGDKENVTVTVTGGNKTAANPGRIYTATATLEGSRADNYKLTNDTQTYTIIKASPTVTVEDVTGTYGDDITITAKVTVPDVDTSLVTGTIQFKDGGTTLGTADVENGTATLTISGTDRDKQHALFGSNGSSTVTAAYSGNDNIEGGSGNGNATISRRTLEYDVTATSRDYEQNKTEVTVSLKPKNLIEGDDVTLAATGNLTSDDAAVYESVSLTGITIDGKDEAYYTVADTADDVTLTAPVTINQIKAVVENPPTGGTSLTYTGDPLSLLTHEATSTGGTMQYYVGEKDSTEQPDETAAWTESISNIMATDAGTYTIWYRANGNIDYATSDLGSITVTIEKAESFVTKEPTPNNRAYDGAAHPLVEAGATEDGTIQYSLEQNGEYSETIPNGQGAGEYTVWYKVVGDANHEDSAPQSVSVTIKKADGTGTLSMADYTCKEAGVEPEATSETNGPAVITYAVKGTENFTDQKPDTAGFYTVKAVFPANQNYNELTLTADFKITHQFNDGWEHQKDGDHHLCACGTELLLETKELTEVPEGLKQNSDVDTVEEIEQVLVEQVATGEYYVIYDVELEALIGGKWVAVTPESLPEEGVAITIPYPEGTNSRYTFTVVHMFTTAGDGHAPGDPEVLAAINEADGIHFTVKSLSPIIVGWKAGNLTVTVTDTGEGADPARQWQFRVELDDKTITGTFGDMEFTAGVATFTLESGQRLTARGLPEGVAYTVTELEANQDGYTTTYTDDSGLITSEQDMVAMFVNDKPAPAKPDKPSDDPDDQPDAPTDNPPDTPTDNPPDTPTSNNPNDTPKTGDESHLALWLSLIILSLLGITVTVRTPIIGKKKLVSTNGRHMRK